MKRPVLRSWFRACSIVAIVLVAAHATAQPYPTKPIRMVVGVPAGSAADVSARRVAEGLAQELGGSVYVDNRPGADGVIAVGQVTSAPADGYTILYGLSSQIAFNPATVANLPYDPQRDLVPVSLVSHQPLLVSVHPSLAVTTVAQLVDWSRRHPGTVNYGTGTSSFMFATEALKLRTGADMQHIPFSGAGQALNALLAGTVQVALTPVPGTLGPVQAGRIRALAVTGSRRLPMLPDVPTYAESGLVDDVPFWTAVFVAPGTPKPVVDALHDALARAFGTPAARERWLQSGDILVVSTPDQLRETVARDIARVDAIAKRLGLAPR